MKLLSKLEVHKMVCESLVECDNNLVVESLTQIRGVAGSILIGGTVLWHCARPFLVRFQTRNTPSNLTVILLTGT